MVTSGTDCTMFNCMTGESITSIDAIAGSTIMDMNASPDGQYFAVLGNEEKQVLVWKYQG